MTTLQRLENTDAAAAWLKARVRATLRTDSRSVAPGDGFVAWPGYATDGRRFVAGALEAGAAACLVEHDGAEAFGFGGDERVASLRGLKAAAGPVADAWFGRPSESLDLIAVTGTNGKTSTAWWTAQALSRLGKRCGLIGTLGIGEPGHVEFTGLTTPDPITFHGALRRFADRGFAACALEASSIGLVEERLNGARIDVALFTNFTQDHLDFHHSMEAYWAAKQRLFDAPGLRAAVVNVDDPQGAKLAEQLHARGDLDLWTVSLRSEDARLAAHSLQYAEAGIGFVVREGHEQAPLQSALVGDYNASNLLVVLGALRALGLPLADAARALEGSTAVPGRMQRLSGNGVEVVIDYAHTPDALEKVLAALRPLADARHGHLVCVFGCGGNRDPGKRPLMGAIAARAADRVVLTSDNPRHEDPRAILAQIRAGIPGEPKQIRLIENRADAIHTAVGEAGHGDVVLLAGKGHEDYQEIAGVKRPFSDEAEAKKALDQRLHRPPSDNGARK